MRKQHRSTLVIKGKRVKIPPDVRRFYYSLGNWGFTVRAENHHEKVYWYAYKRINGKLRKRYVSTYEELTFTALMAAAFVFQDLRMEAVCA